ncbi:MAG: ion channel [Phycisphaerales bacterium]
MDLFWGVVGAAIIGWTMVEALWTIVSVSGAGPATDRWTRALWRLAVMLRTRVGHAGSLVPVGPVILIATLLVWIATLWLGYFLVFSVCPDEIINSDTKIPATTWDRVYYTGFTLFTLGTGDFVALTTRYRVLSAFASLNGLFLVTLVITYMVPVLQAVVVKRQLGAVIHGLGETPYAIIANAWNGKDLSALDTPLHELSSSIAIHAERHLAYPVLHYFQADSARHSFALQFASYAEAIELIDAFVPEEAQPPRLRMITARDVSEGFLEVVGREFFVRTADDAPPLPDPKPLAAAGLPIRPVTEGFAALDRRADYRRRLRSLLRSEGRDWDEVYQSDANQDDANENE